MTSPLSFFSKKEMCKPLMNVEGKHVDKYRFFKTFLGHNQAALKAMALMEQMYYSGKPFSLAASMMKYQELSEEVMGALHAFDAMSRGKFSSLMDMFTKMDSEISREFSPQFSLMTTDTVLHLENITPEMKTIVGSKAANLASIKNVLGLPVPHGFVVTSHAFERFLEETGLSKPVEKELSKIPLFDSVHAMRMTSDTLKKMIRQATVPSSIVDEIMKAYESLERKTYKGVRVAMRSSAIGEDSEASFAGQYETVLNVREEEILEAYKTVLASKYATHVLNYMFQYGLHDRDTPMAVLGIAMVDAKAAGVVYSLNPSQDNAETVKISSVWGLGEYLVSGRSSPDSFLVERDGEKIIEKTIGIKERKIIRLDSGGTKLIEVPEEERAAPSIDDSTVLKLRDYALMLESFFENPQDMEWAVDAERNLFVLQSRPLHLSRAPSVSRIIPEDYPDNPILLKGGEAASSGIAAGNVFIVRHADDLDKIPENAVLVAKIASPDYVRAMGRIAGIITDTGSITSHLSSVAREFDVPAIVDAKEATSLLPDGEMVTMVAETKTVYKGIVEKLVKDIRHVKRLIFESPVHKRMRVILDKISPLNLVDPEHPSFSSEGCRTIHDIIRFTHEQAMKTMFGLTEEADEVRSIRLTATIPLILHLIDLGGGLKRGLTTCHTVTPEDIESLPMKALWRGFTHPGITWEGAMNFDMKKIMTLFAASAASESGGQLGGVSYAILSGDYLNLSAKFGYHFATIDALCGENSSQNYLSLQFAGGAGSYYGKSLRISLLGTILKKLGFQVSLQGDLIEAFVVGYDRASLENVLDQMGRLLASSRLLDMALSDQRDIEIFTDAFFKGDYDFLSTKRDDQLRDFYTHGGRWKRSIEDDHVYANQDGAESGYTFSSGVAGIMGKLVGQALQDFLDNIEAYYYFPLAIAKNSEMADGTVSVRVKPVSGNIDRAGGIAFGLRNVGNYFVLRINALEDNVILFEYINGKRIQRAVTQRKIEAGKWNRLTVEIKGAAITGRLDGEPVVEYAAERPVKGFIGLWTKADSVTRFDELSIQTDNQKRVLEF